MKPSKRSKKITRLCVLILFVLVCVGSGVYPPELALNRSTHARRSRKTLLEVPVSFGKTHFIVGLSKEDVAPRKQTVTYSHDECTVNDAYFAPDDDLQQKLVSFIEQEKKGVRLAIFSFTDKKIADALIQAKERGVEVEVVADPGFLHDRFTKVAMLNQHDIHVYVYDPKCSPGNGSTMSNIMHNKFAIFLDNVDDKPLVWTGSFNWTKSARLSNQENVIVLNHPHIVQKYIDKFDELKKRTIRYNKIHDAMGRASDKLKKKSNANAHASS